MNARLDLSLDVSVDNLDKKYGYSNTYALTESFGMVTSIILESKDYDIIPAGKVCPLTNVKICDKDGNELPQGEMGELCVENIYFRGYINQPELSAEKYRNGWIYTGDLAYVDKDGMYYVLGRKIDTLETEKGYIIPSMISAAIKRLFPDIAKTYIKLFPHDDNIKICIYYCSDKEYSIGDFKSALSVLIPEYMMPTHCVRMDDFEYFNFGKINRLSFVEPE